MPRLCCEYAVRPESVESSVGRLFGFTAFAKQQTALNATLYAPCSDDLLFANAAAVLDLADSAQSVHLAHHWSMAARDTHANGVATTISQFSTTAIVRSFWGYRWCSKSYARYGHLLSLHSDLSCDE